MKSKNCKCYVCGNDLAITDITVNSHYGGRTFEGFLISNGAYPDDGMKLTMRCVYCNTNYQIDGYKYDLEKLVEW